ncbi:MAG TPA: tetratricopeptide repeat protein, partial [Pyrinomonadaceae bacterium]|nr:tetratricopeptide repeat protein [Pyrinomonadaceae bacterium]
LDQIQRQIRQEATARKALELDPNLADAHYAMAQFKRNNGEWAEAEREYKRAAELNPNLSKVYSGYSNYLHYMNRKDEAVAAIRRALELNPLSIVINVNAINTYYLARRYDEAISAAKKAFELEPNNSVGHSRLGNVYEMKGMYAEALAEYREVLRLSGARGEGPNFARVYAKMGERAKAEEILQKFEASENNVQGRDLALLYDALGRRDEAFTELERDYAENGSNLAGINANPLYDNLRSDSRFADLLRRMNLPQ